MKKIQIIVEFCGIFTDVVTCSYNCNRLNGIIREKVTAQVKCDKKRFSERFRNFSETFK